MLATAASSGGLFEAPGGCALPYGTLQTSHDAAGKRAEFDAMLADLESISDALSPEFEKACGELREFVASVDPPAELISAVAAAVPAVPGASAGVICPAADMPSRSSTFALLR